MSRDDFLYVGKRGELYVIVNRSASVEGADEIDDEEREITNRTRADQAVLEANRIQAEELTEYGVHFSPATQKALGWIREPKPEKKTDDKQVEEEVKA